MRVVNRSLACRHFIFRPHKASSSNVSALGAFFSCYTKVLQSEAFISTAAGDVMTGVEMTGVDGLGGI